MRRALDASSDDGPPVARLHHLAQPAVGLDPTKKFALLVFVGVELGKVIDIETTTVTIGRSGCEVLLDDAEFSRRHAQIRIEGDKMTLVDRGSKNCIFVNDQRIDSATIENRSKFRVGGHELTFVVTEREG
jgi:pSer/pThr/pTyr-binding forkhead associated (FHA) protein